MKKNFSKECSMRAILGLITAFTLSFSTFAKESDAIRTVEIKQVLQVHIDGAIGPATYEYLKSALDSQNQKEATALLIKLTTPGGLVSTTKQILNLFGDSSIPIIVWIAPQGSSATSAGAIISAGAHFLFMSQGTNIGAATPVGIGGDLKKEKSESDEGGDLRAKAINDLSALTKSLAQLRGRNEQAYERMISQAASFSSKEALDLKIIDGIADDEAAIWAQLSQKTISLHAEKVRVKISAPPVLITFAPSLGQKILMFFANPEMAYILFLAAMALLYFEFQAPGGYVAGSFGVLALIFSAMGFQLLTVNLGGVLLLALALVLFILEVYLPSLGLLSVAGIAALVTGSLILYKTEDSLFVLPTEVIYGAVIPLLMALGLMAFLFYKTRLRKKSQEFFAVANQHASVVGILPGDGAGFHFQVKVDGQIWRAHGKESYAVGDWVEVTQNDPAKLTLEITKKV